MKDKLKILIVDDSLIFRSALKEALGGEMDMEVIGSERNGLKAMEFIRKNRPDLVTLDVEMPEMDGMETLKAIRAFNMENRESPPIGVIMLSIFTKKGMDITIKALQLGAFDFVAKPLGENLNDNMESLCRQVINKARYFNSRMIADRLQEPGLPNIHIPKGRINSGIKHPSAGGGPVSKARKSSVRAVLIGVSTGGPKALMNLLPPLCLGINAPIFVVQHMPPEFTRFLAKSLDSKCVYDVAEGANGGVVRDRNVYLAPGGKHMLIRSAGSQITTVINQGPPVESCRPSADVLFRSAATALGGGIVAVILTGMGSDGTRGIEAIKRAGGYVIVQDKSTSVVWGMPKSAAESGHADEILPLDEIPGAIINHINKTP